MSKSVAVSHIRRWYQGQKALARWRRSEHPVKDTVLICAMFFMAWNQIPATLADALTGRHPLDMWLGFTSGVGFVLLATWESVQLRRVRKNINRIGDAK